MTRPVSIDETVDWSAPWLTNLRQVGTAIAQASDWRAALNLQATQGNLRNHANLPLHFVPQSELPEGVSYEAFISATGKVPTRENLHDFFNALVWLTFPQIKSQLNALQAKQIEKLGIGKSRGAARDAATLFDENAAILTVTNTPEGQAIVHALQNHEWSAVFVDERHQFLRQANVFLFGHAIMEKLVCPYKAITAHTLVCWVDSTFHQLNDTEQCAILDRQIAHSLAQKELLPTAFSPLPILGVPGWWPGQAPEFYADVAVFRPKRKI